MLASIRKTLSDMWTGDTDIDGELVDQGQQRRLDRRACLTGKR